MNELAVLFWKRVNTLIKSAKTKQQTVAEACGISYQTFRGWVTRQVFPDAFEAVKIANFLSTSVEYLVEGSPKQQVSDETLKFQALNSEHKKMILAMIEAFYNEEDRQFMENPRKANGIA